MTMSVGFKETSRSIPSKALPQASLLPEEPFGDRADFHSVDPELGSLAELFDQRLVLEALSDINWSFQSDKTSYLSHDIHPYPAKIIPQIPRNLISQLSLRGEVGTE